MHSLERSARASFQPGELPSLTSPPPWPVVVLRAWLGRTTCGSGCRILPWGIGHSRELPHRRDTRVDIYQKDALCVHTSDRSTFSSTRDRHVSLTRSGCRLLELRHDRDLHLDRPSAIGLVALPDPQPDRRRSSHTLYGRILLHPIRPNLTLSQFLHSRHEWPSPPAVSSNKSGLTSQTIAIGTCLNQSAPYSVESSYVGIHVGFLPSCWRRELAITSVASPTLDHPKYQ